MPLPTVEHCCCCVDLITAGKIMGWLGVLNGILSFIGSFNHIGNLLAAAASIALSACWLYGIEKSQPSYLLLNVVLTTIGIVILYIADVIILLVAVYIATLSEKPKELNDFPLAFIVFVVILMTILATYCWVITNSVYAAVKERSKELPNVYHGVSRGVCQDASKIPA
ncbi:uncharacterized protein LOC129568940 [Sitodiplosis mosellana]|uniref:uncharacterized protein LOC129568940 n=1 Tax=Sitodiplosis mosellana TaxID=263140 RepID=UPI002443FFEA|nr:uncharacterized protein LOC129568940 [Sitodiplosis mosellana]